MNPSDIVQDGERDSLGRRRWWEHRDAHGNAVEYDEDEACVNLHQFPPSSHTQDGAPASAFELEVLAKTFRHAEDYDDVAVALDVGLLVLDADGDHVLSLEGSSVHSPDKATYRYCGRHTWLSEGGKPPPSRYSTNEQSVRYFGIEVAVSMEADMAETMVLLGVEPVCVLCGSHRYVRDAVVPDLWVPTQQATESVGMYDPFCKHTLIRPTRKV